VESIHGVLEWFIIVFLAVGGFAVGRWVPLRKVRYPFYVFLLLGAFILDLNKASFRSDVANAVFYLFILFALSEVFWICVRKRSRLLLSGAFVALVPVFLYAYAAFLLTVPLPCHDLRTEVFDEYKCGAGDYTLTKRLSFDPFAPAQVYILTKDIRYTPLKRQIDRYPAPKGYIEAQFVPQWECTAGGKAKVNLHIDGYTLWSLEEKAEK
jgi:hypothetical protein